MSDSATSTAASARVAILGAGTIGRGMALLFASSGFAVAVHEPDPKQRQEAPGLTWRSLLNLRNFDLIEEDPELILSRISWQGSLDEAVEATSFIHECGPENVAIRRAIFEQLDQLAPSHALIASSSSAMPASSFTGGLALASRTLIAHPANPPFLLRVIEIVPSPTTSTEAVRTTREIMKSIGLHPVLLGKEVEGFAFNRLQGALLREAYCLVRDGVASVDDIDALVREGLGLRWSVIGPFETADLNTRGGIEEHARRLGPAYARMGAERGQHDPWTPELVAKVTAARRAQVPIEQWSERTAWRDRQIMAALAGRSARSPKSGD